MAGAVPTLWWFDRFDDRSGILPVVGELVHTEELLELGHRERGLNARAFSLKNVPEGTFSLRSKWRGHDRVPLPRGSRQGRPAAVA